MSTVKVTIVHDEVGRIVSVARPAPDAQVTVLSGKGESVLEAEVNEELVRELATGKHRVDVAGQRIVPHKG